MYKIFGFRGDETFGRVALVEFSTPVEGDETYAYLLGSFNAFNEGSFRMMRDGRRWRLKVELPEGTWYYGFSVGGNYTADPENPEKTTYKRDSYKFERTASVATITGDEEVLHVPSLLYLYTFSDRTHVLLRAKRGRVKEAMFVADGRVPMRRKGKDSLFEYFEVVVPVGGRMEYSFEITMGDGETRYLGPFEAVPQRISAPEWVLGTVFYQIMPDRFAMGLESKDPVTGDENLYGGDLRGVRNHLDHLSRLGVNGLYLTPIFESKTYHGYDVEDYFHVAGRLGGDAEFEPLVRELKARGIKLVLDGVFHHTSFFHPYFQDLIRKGEGSEYREFYRTTGFPVLPEEFIEILSSRLPWGEKYLRLKGMERNYESFFSVWLMPRLNHDSRRVREFMVNVMRYWLERGADGWRLDVAHGVPPGVWREVRERMPEDAYLVGEVMDDARLWLFEAFHGVMNYRLYDALLRFFVTEEIGAEEFLNELELLSAYYGPAEYFTYNFLDNHDTERFLDLVNGDVEKYLCALAFLMTYRGIPSIFYGDEIGLRGNGEGMASGRTPMRWNPENWNTKVLTVTKELINLRRSSRALQTGEFRPLEFREKVLVYERMEEDERVLVAINLSDGAVEIAVPWERGMRVVAPRSFLILRRAPKGTPRGTLEYILP